MEQEIVQYSLGLGQLNSSSALGRERHNKNADKLLLMNYESAQSTHNKELTKRKTQPLHKRTLYGKTNCEGSIKRLLARAAEHHSERPGAFTQRLPATAKGQTRATFGTGREVGVFGGGQEEQELLRKRKERWSAAPKGDRRESVREYIQNTRNILLTRITMNEKQQEAKRMQEYIQQKESVLNLNKEIYDQDKNMIDKYVEFMKNEALLKKHEVSSKAKIRHDKETELEDLIQIRTKLKKTLSENKETCANYKSYTDFLHSLNPEGKRVVDKPRRKGFFVTDRGQDKGAEYCRKESLPADKDLAEIRNELGLTEYDSDTEVQPGFASVREILELMDKLIAGNLSLIQSTQKREESLERIHKEYSHAIGEKSTILESIRNDTRELADEERRKMLRFTELKERMESDILVTNTRMFASEKMKEQVEAVKRLRGTIKGLIWAAREVFTPADKQRTREVAGTFDKDMVAVLGDVTACVLRLKMVRDWKFMTEGSASLLKREMEEKDRQKQRMAEEAIKKNAILAEKKREDLLRSWKVPRYRKHGKEIMQKKVLKGKQRRVATAKEQKVDNEFDDKYFVD